MFCTLLLATLLSHRDSQPPFTTRHALTPMRMLPDLAIVFVSDATKHADAVADVANALASLLPPSTLVLAASATGMLGPLSP